MSMRYQWLGDGIIVESKNGTFLQNSRGYLQIKGKFSYKVCCWLKIQFQQKKSLNEILVKTENKIHPLLNKLLVAFINHRFIVPTTTKTYEQPRYLKLYQPDLSILIQELPITKLHLRGNELFISSLLQNLEKLKLQLSISIEVANILGYVEIDRIFKIKIGVKDNELYIAAHQNKNYLQQLKLEEQVRVDKVYYSLAVCYLAHLLFRHVAGLKNKYAICKIAIPTHFYRFNPLLPFPPLKTLAYIPSLTFFQRSDIPIINDSAIYNYLNKINNIIIQFTDALTGPLINIEPTKISQLPLASYDVIALNYKKQSTYFPCYGLSARECRYQAALYGLEHYLSNEDAGNLVGVGYSVEESLMRAVLQLPALPPTESSELVNIKENDYELANYFILALCQVGINISTVFCHRIDNFFYRVSCKDIKLYANGITIHHAMLNLLQRILISAYYTDLAKSTLLWTGFDQQQLIDFCYSVQEKYQIHYSHIHEIHICQLKRKTPC